MNKLGIGLATGALVAVTIVAVVGLQVSSPPSGGAAGAGAAERDAFRTDRTATGATAPVDRFWSHLRVVGREAEVYDRLHSMTTNASAVVAATVQDVREGRVILGKNTEDPQRFSVAFAEVELRVKDVIAGELEPEASDGDRVVVEFMVGTAADAPAVVAALRRTGLPTGPALFFLRWKGDPIPGGGTPTALEGDRRFYRLVSLQGLFAHDDGRVVVPLFDDHLETFPAPYRGRDFAEVETEVRAAASG